MNFAEVLQFLNLPILGGIVVLIFKAGRLAEKVEGHGERLSTIEGLAWERRRAVR